MVTLNLGEELLGLIWFLHYVNDLHNDLEDLKVSLPIYFAQVFEKDFLLRIHFGVLLNVNMHYFMVKVAFKGLLRVPVRNVDIHLVLVPLINGVLRAADDYSYLLQVFEIVSKNFV